MGGKTRENTKRKKKIHEFEPIKRTLRKKIEKENKNWEEKKRRFFFEFKTKKFFLIKTKQTNKKSHSLCATIMTLYNIVTITTYITIRMSHIPIHHQNLV